MINSRAQSGVRSTIRTKSNPLCLYFSCLSAELELIGFSYNKIDGLPFVLEEAKESIRVLSWGLDNINCAVAYGVFFTQQVILIDFLSYVCSPFHHLILSPDGNSECFHLIIPMLRKEAPRCKILSIVFVRSRKISVIVLTRESCY